MREEAHEPNRQELHALTILGRLQRMVEQEGLTPAAAAAKMLQDESAVEYAERNRQAMDELEKRILSPEYMERWRQAYEEPDPEKRAAALAAIKRENYATIDMEAVHRTIASRNRQLKAEGLLPPDAPI